MKADLICMGVYLGCTYSRAFKYRGHFDFNAECNSDVANLVRNCSFVVTYIDSLRKCIQFCSLVK